mmetsp:Transcript_24691/g.36396  ORF Transcript_24691/g.36396 Transcript_24691/m.36396 type:complete len:477 (-) Transcript_24691:265-1695(-)|eukprot:CAMPEP_0185034122 /NCGR_PEP_ID=MMETSP1103-20130426/23695_1 /TAXON_ID=36769 /ORGANISM="Paraphysomonas bandaiensis, Strain Caron Lab Isolate" /LENGTH=476 /DNA_ID=CAMNT_0027570647 /DNA_START=150 /DNA_END=1580 /DNA_ORIENTATION=-
MQRLIVSLLTLLLSISTRQCTDTLSAGVFSPNEMYVVIPVDVLGLANRLRIMASAYSISQTMSRKLIIIWTASYECNAEFSDLFEVDSEASGVRVVSYDSNTQLTNDKLISDFRNISHIFKREIAVKFPKEFFVNTSFNTRSNGSGEQKSPWIILLRTAGSHAPIDMTCDDYMDHKSAFYRSLVPIKMVKSMVTELLNLLRDGNEDGPLVGVHVRAYDAAYDWAVVTPAMCSSDEKCIARALRFDESTPLAVVISSMQEIQEKHPSVRFFLASNSEPAKRAVVSHFSPGRVLAMEVVTELASRRDLADAVRLALVDLIVLGNCDLILHSRGSSFAQEAAYMHHSSPPPVVDLSVVNWGGEEIGIGVLTVYKMLPFCGLHDYLNAASRESANDKARSLLCYSESDSADSNGRVVCSYKTEVSLCEGARRKWGLRALYCVQEQNRNGAVVESIATEELPGVITILPDINGYSAASADS